MSVNWVNVLDRLPENTGQKVKRYRIKGISRKGIRFQSACGWISATGSRPGRFFRTCDITHWAEINGPETKDDE